MMAALWGLVFFISTSGFVYIPLKILLSERCYRYAMAVVAGIVMIALMLVSGIELVLMLD